MLSPVFWLSLVAVFLGMKWLAEGLLSLAQIEVRHVKPAAAEPIPWRDDAALKEAA
ncbi:MAG: hypothetical protein BMS9Abin37_2328 [Acidobacteriota bacterium]|nr:MAG: hypothetical protein BMS9Abin37_2328 [Acidobacteriota bacterium]